MTHIPPNLPLFCNIYLSKIQPELKKMLQLAAAPIKYLKFLKIYVIIYIENEKRRKDKYEL